MGRTEYNLERNTSRYFSKALHSKFTCVKSSPTRGIRNKGLAYTLHPAARAPYDLWNEMNEIKEALAREGVLLDSKLSHSGEPTVSFTQLLSSSGPCTD